MTTPTTTQPTERAMKALNVLWDEAYLNAGCVDAEGGHIIDRATGLPDLLEENKRLRGGCEIGEKLAEAVAELAPETLDRFEVLTALGTIRAALAEGDKT